MAEDPFLPATAIDFSLCMLIWLRSSCAIQASHPHFGDMFTFRQSAQFCFLQFYVLFLTDAADQFQLFFFIIQRITQPLDPFFFGNGPMTIVKSDVRNYCNYSCLLLVKSLLWLPSLFLGTSAATPGVLSLSGGSCSGSSGSSIGYAPVTETYLPRDFGPHQGGVSVPPDTVPQVSVQQFCIINVSLHAFDRPVPC